jgi:hypothetical protein
MFGKQKREKQSRPAMVEKCVVVCGDLFVALVYGEEKRDARELIYTFDEARKAWTHADDKETSENESGEVKGKEEPCYAFHLPKCKRRQC